MAPVTSTISAPKPTYSYAATIKPYVTITPLTRATPYATTMMPVIEPRVKTGWIEEKINALLKWFRWI